MNCLVTSAKNLKEKVSPAFLWGGAADANVSFPALPKASSGHAPVTCVGELTYFPNLESLRCEVGINNKIILWIP